MNTIRNIMLATALITAGTVQANGETPTKTTETNNLASKTRPDCYGPLPQPAYPFDPTVDQRQIQEWMNAQQKAMETQRKAQLEAMETHRKAQLEAMQTQQKAMNDYVQQLYQTYRPTQEPQTATVTDDYRSYPPGAYPTEWMDSRWQAFEARRQARDDARRVRWEEFDERRQQLLADVDATRDAFYQQYRTFPQYPIVAATDNTNTEQ